MTVDYQEYKPNNTISFILTDTKTIATTGMQTFIIQYDHRNYSKMLQELREAIQRNEITSASQLITYCDFYPSKGQRGRMHGLEMIPTRIERYIC